MNELYYLAVEETIVSNDGVAGFGGEGLAGEISLSVYILTSFIGHEIKTIRFNA